MEKFLVSIKKRNLFRDFIGITIKEICPFRKNSLADKSPDLRTGGRKTHT